MLETVDSSIDAVPLRLEGQRHVLHVMPSFGMGGIQIRLARVINRLGPKYRHTIVALDGVSDCVRLLSRAAFYSVRTQAMPHGMLPSLQLAGKAIGLLAPDLLVTYNWGAIEWAMAHRLQPNCRHIHFEDGFGKEESERQLLRRVLFRRLALAKAERIVVPSRLLENIALQKWKLRDDRVVYVPNGVDLPRFGQPPEKSFVPLLRDGQVPVIGSVVPLRPEKNVARLIRAFAAIADKTPAVLAIAGDGSERQALEQLSVQLGLAERVVFLGHIDKPESVLGHFDMFAISSDTEQMPIAVLEAMAAGLPVAGVDVGDVKAMIAPENSPFIQGRDDESLARVMGLLIDNAAQRRTLGRLNRARAWEMFDQERMFAAYDRLFWDAN